MSSCSNFDKGTPTSQTTTSTTQAKTSVYGSRRFEKLFTQAERKVNKNTSPHTRTPREWRTPHAAVNGCCPASLWVWAEQQQRRDQIISGTISVGVRTIALIDDYDFVIVDMLLCQWRHAWTRTCATIAKIFFVRILGIEFCGMFWFPWSFFHLRRRIFRSYAEKLQMKLFTNEKGFLTFVMSEKLYWFHSVRTIIWSHINTDIIIRF